MSDNTLTITGNLAADPDLRFTQSGLAVASMTVMQTKRVKQGDQWVDADTNGVQVTAWRALAENIAESLGKGDLVTVTGTLDPRNWVDRNTGDKRYGWEINATDVAVSLRYATAKPVKVNRSQNLQKAPSPQGEEWNSSYDRPPF